MLARKADRPSRFFDQHPRNLSKSDTYLHHHVIFANRRSLLLSKKEGNSFSLRSDPRHHRRDSGRHRHSSQLWPRVQITKTREFADNQ